MIIKRIRKLTVGPTTFKVRWDKDFNGATFNYATHILKIGTYTDGEVEVLEKVCHELWEMVALELDVRLHRPDCDSDYIFVYDHRQHASMARMFAGLLSQFL